MKRRSANNRTRGGNSRTVQHVEYVRAHARMMKEEGVSQMKLGELEIALLRPAHELPERIGFEVPPQGEQEWEPEETRRRSKRKGRGGT